MPQSGFLVLALLLLVGLFCLTYWIHRRQRAVIEQLLASQAQAAAAPAGNSDDLQRAAPVSVLADRVHEAVLLHGPEGIVYANQQFSNLRGAPAADLVGGKLADTLPPEDSDRGA